VYLTRSGTVPTGGGARRYTAVPAGGGPVAAL